MAVLKAKVIYSVIVLVNLNLQFSSAQMGFGEILNDADVLSNMNGAFIQDHVGEHTEEDLFLNYHLLNNTVDNVTGKIDDLAIENGRFTLRIRDLFGVLTGRIDAVMDSNITYGFKRLRTLKVKVEAQADYVILSKGVEIIAEMVIRDLTSGDLGVETCSGTAKDSIISLQNVMPENIPKFTVGWLTSNLNRAISKDVERLYCNAIAHELQKGAESAMLQEILKILIRAILQGGK